MAYGIMVKTPAGLQSIDAIRSAQVVLVSPQTAASGSLSLPSGVTGGQCFGFCEVFDELMPPIITFSTNSMSWAAEAQYASVDFRIFVMRYQ